MANDASILPALFSAASAIVSGLFAAWISIRAKRQDQLQERMKLQVTTYDTKLLEQRLKDYRDLWLLTAPTSRGRVRTLSSEASAELADRLTNWYYAGGGMVLSAEARNAFFLARARLHFKADVRDENLYIELVAAFSALRTSMCEDLNSRRGPTSMSHLEETATDARIRMAAEQHREQQMQQE